MSLQEIPKKLTDMLMKKGANDVVTLLLIEESKTIRYA